MAEALGLYSTWLHATIVKSWLEKSSHLGTSKFWFCFSEKSDLNSDIGRKPPPSVIVGPPGLPTETMYSASPGRRPHTITHGGASPEAMKVRLSAMVLQPPTRV